MTSRGIQKWPRCGRVSPNLSGLTIRGQAASRYIHRSRETQQTVEVTVTLLDSKREAEKLFEAIARPFGSNCLSASIGEVGSYELYPVWASGSVQSIEYNATLARRDGRPLRVEYAFATLGRSFITFAFTGSPGRFDWKLEGALSNRVLLRLGL